MRIMIYSSLLFIVSCSMSSESFKQHSWYETIDWETYDKNIR